MPIRTVNWKEEMGREQTLIQSFPMWRLLVKEITQTQLKTMRRMRLRWISIFSARRSETARRHRRPGLRWKYRNSLWRRAGRRNLSHPLSIGKGWNRGQTSNCGWYREMPMTGQGTAWWREKNCRERKSQKDVKENFIWRLREPATIWEVSAGRSLWRIRRIWWKMPKSHLAKIWKILLIRVGTSCWPRRRPLRRILLPWSADRSF